MKFHWDNQVTLGPIRLLALLIAITALGFAVAAYIGNPVEEVEDHVIQPVGVAAGIVHERCPSGWKDTTNIDIHIINRTCERDGILVILDEDNRFNYAVELEGDIIEEESEVPGWLD